MKRLIFISLWLLSFAAFGQSVDGGLKTLTASRTHTYTITEPLPTAYSAKERFLVRFTNANTGAATLNRSSLGARSIVKADGSALSAGDIEAGGTYLLSYNGTNYQMVGDGGGGGGVTDHGALTGLADDDHTQYHNDTRGDARYPQLTGSYNDPSWITGLAWSKITGEPTTLTGYGITDAWSLATGGTLTGNNTITMGSNTITFTGNRVSFTPDATVSGFNTGGVASDPSTLVNGDIWYNNSFGFKVRRGGETEHIATIATLATNRVPYGGSSGGLLQASANLTFDGTGLLVGGGTITANTRVDIRGTGTTTNIALRVADSGNNQILQLLDNGNSVIGFGNATMQLGTTGNSTLTVLGVGGVLNSQGWQYYSNSTPQVIYTPTGAVTSALEFGTGTVFSNDSDYSHVRIRRGFSSVTGSSRIYQNLLIDPTYNITAGTHIVIGVNYNPSITSLAGASAHRAFQSTRGDVLFFVDGATISHLFNNSLGLHQFGNSSTNYISASNGLLTPVAGGTALEYRAQGTNGNPNGAAHYFYVNTGVSVTQSTGAYLWRLGNAQASAVTLAINQYAMGITPTWNSTNASSTVYGIYYSPSITSIAGPHYAAVFGTGQVGIGTLTPTANTRLDVRGIGTTTGNLALFQDSGGTSRLRIQDNGYQFWSLPQNDDALTQVLVRDGSTGEIKYRTAGSFGGGGWAVTGNTTLTGDVAIFPDAATYDLWIGSDPLETASITQNLYLLSSNQGLLEATDGNDGGSVTVAGSGTVTIQADDDASADGYIEILHDDGFRFPASTTNIASFNVPHGTAPTSPVNGDIWTTTTSMYARINGTTVDLAGGGGGIGGSTGATDNSVLRADGTGGSTLQNSGVLIQDDGDIEIGTDAGITRSIIATGSGSNIGLYLVPKGSSVVTVQNAMNVSSLDFNSSLSFDPDNSTGPALFPFYNSTKTQNGPFLIRGASGNATGTASGQDLSLQGGNAHTSGNNNGGSINLTPGAPNGSGLEGTININGVLEFTEEASPATPAADKMRLFAKDVAGRTLPAFRGPSGIESTLQATLARNKVAVANPNGNATTLTSWGISLTATGTATAANVATTNLHTQIRGLEYLVTTASTTAVAGFRSTAAQFWRGNAAGRGGFYAVITWGPATGVATSTNRAFVGLTNATGAPTDVEPSSLTNMIGMGWDAADTNIQLMHNDGSGTATKIDLGSNFPVPGADRTDVYEIVLFCAPNGSVINYQVTDLTDDTVATGSVSTDLISNTTLMAPRGWMSVGGTSSVIGIALKNLYIETDY